MKTNDLITDKEAAEILGVSTAYLAHLRCTSRMTKLNYTKRDRHIYYRPEDVKRFMDIRAEKKKYSRKKVVCPHD